MARIPVVFLPGILAPAAVRYGPLLQELSDSVEPLTKELELYAEPEPPAGYSIETEVEGLSRAADAAGFERFHIFGHSAGGAIALAYIAANPGRGLSLALDEPASDFSDEDREQVHEINAGLAAPGLLPAERQAAFLRLQVAEGVKLPPPPPPPSPEFARTRAAGVPTFAKALELHRVPADAWQHYAGRVYFSHGSLSHPRWQTMRDRLASQFLGFQSEYFEEMHHLRPCHQVDPGRAAASLKAFWSV